MGTVSELRSRSGIEYLILNSVYMSMPSERNCQNEQEDRKFIFDVKDYLDGIIDGSSLIAQIREKGRRYLQTEVVKNGRSLMRALDEPDEAWNSVLIETTSKIEKMLNCNYE